MDDQHQRQVAGSARRRLFEGGDAQLAAAARTGSEDAFTAIVDRHERALHRYAAKLLRGTGHDPEDVVQDVFIRAHTALTSGQAHVSDLKPWLFRMTRNRAIDLLRRRDRADASLDAEHAAEPIAPQDTEPPHAADRREALRLVMVDLAALPEQQRDALLMRELEGMSHETVAAELGVTPQATRMLVVRARDNLIKAAAAREASCPDIRVDLASAHDARRRSSEHARRHVRHCGACRSYRRQLHDTRRRVALMHPGPVILGLLGLAKLGGAWAFVSGGKATAVLTTAAVAVTAGAAVVVVIQHPTVGAGDPAPRIVPGSKCVFGERIIRGGRLPAGTVQVEASLRLPPVERRRSTVLRMTCPVGYVAAATVPSEGNDPVLRGARLEDKAPFGRARSIHWRVFWTRSSRPHTATVRMGLLCTERSRARP